MQARHGLLQDNVALIVVLDATAGQGQEQEKPADVPRRQLICVANTHIHANPELNDVKLWQVQDHHPYGPLPLSSLMCTSHGMFVMQWLGAYVAHCGTKYRTLPWRRKRIRDTIKQAVKLGGHDLVALTGIHRQTLLIRRPSLEPHLQAFTVCSSHTWPFLNPNIKYMTSEPARRHQVPASVML